MRWAGKKIVAGMGIGTKGYANIIQSMRYAWENAEMVGGHIEWSVFGAPRFIVDSATGGAGVTSTPKPYDISLALDVVSKTTDATLSHLYHGRNVITTFRESTLSSTLSNVETVYVGIEMDLTDNSTDIITGTTLASVSETAAPAPTATTLKRALYKLTSVLQTIDSVEQRVFSVSMDIRNMPVFFAQI